ncbi:MAG: lipid II flippase MurJ [Candidatus Peregrinibacteria bacterium]
MLSRLKPLLNQERILGGALVVAVTQMLGSIVGLIRDNLLNRTFPGLGVIDVYYAAFRPSDLLFQIFIMAGFSVALVPLLAKYHVDKDRTQMSQLMNGAVTVAALVFGSIALVLGIAFRPLAPLLTEFTGPRLDLYISFGRIALLTNFLFVFGNAYGQYLNTIQRFWVYGLTPVLYTIGTILGTLFLTPYIGPHGPIVGTFVGAVLFVLWRLVSVIHHGYRPKIHWWHPELKSLGILMIPRMIALGMIQLELLLFDRIASGLPAGSISINAFARNFQSVIMGITGTALALSLFSPLSQAAAKQDWPRFWGYLRKGMLFMLAFTIPGSIGLVITVPIAAWLIHLEPMFVPLFFICIVLYAFSVLFEGMNNLFTRAFFASRNTTVPAIFTVINGAVAIAISWLLAPKYGVASIALGYTIGHVVEMMGLILYLPKEGRGVKAEF